MRNAQFDDIVENLTPANFDTLRGYILDVVRAEYGPLILDLQNQQKPEAEEPWIDKAPEPSETEEEVPTQETREAPSLLAYLLSRGITIRIG
jgi:hypothetical protein